MQAASTRPVASASFSKPTLVDTPLSNNGARVRWVLYKKKLESEVDIVSPAHFGGLKSDEYLELNPLGKMPLLILPEGPTALPESQVIESYLLDKYGGQGPALLPATPELRARASLAARIMDLYITPHQGALYRKMPAEQRHASLTAIATQIDFLETIVVGPFVAGAEPSIGDGALFPTFCFLNAMLPAHFGWGDVYRGRPKLREWWTAISADPEAARCIEEMLVGLEAWEEGKRWDAMGITAQVAAGGFDWGYK